MTLPDVAAREYSPVFVNIYSILYCEPDALIDPHNFSPQHVGESVCFKVQIPLSALAEEKNLKRKSVVVSAFDEKLENRGAVRARAREPKRANTGRGRLAYEFESLGLKHI